MKRNALVGWNKTQLRVALIVFFLALAIPTGVLIRQAYSQLKWEAFHQHRVLAEELVTRIDRHYSELIELESARAFTDYSFLNVAGDPAAKLVQRSPLSSYPVKSAIPGTLGYFQIDTQGRFSTPLLPDVDPTAATYGITKTELGQRLQLRQQVYQLLSENHLLHKPEVARSKRDDVEKKAEVVAELSATPQTGLLPSLRQPRQLTTNPQESQEVASQAMFDKLTSEKDATSSRKMLPKSLGRVEDLNIEDRYQQKYSKQQQIQAELKADSKKSKSVLRKESNVLPEKLSKLTADKPVAAVRGGSRVNMFESEIDAFEFSVLDSGHFVLYRKVWREGQRYIQGLLIDPTVFIQGMIETAFYETALSQASSLAVAYQGNVLSVLRDKNAQRYLASAGELQGTLLYQSRLSMPLSRMEFIFSVSSLPAGPGGVVISWLAFILLFVLCGGFYLMYRLGVRQITLAQQQQDFVSAVSHELKTPLTSIRMYGEILREGWASEEKRKTYYDFIYEESERLTRLINNVLQLARMTRNDLHIELKTYPVAQLMDTVRSKISSQVERAGFGLTIDCPENCRDSQLHVDADYFIQVIINLVDNALKFSSKATTRQVDIRCQQLRDGSLQFSVRDYGPGVPKDQMRKIFRLFYRTENELTRETIGTGIGLALVNQLVLAMHGKVDVVNQEQGAEFRVTLPAVH
jgi:signal transduction histidine kinase